MAKPPEIRIEQDGDFELWSKLTNSPQGEKAKIFTGIMFKLTGNQAPSTQSESLVLLNRFQGSTGITLTPKVVEQLIAKANNSGAYTLKATPYLYAKQDKDYINEAVELLNDNSGKLYILMMKATCKHADGTSKSWEYNQSDPLIKQFNKEDFTEGSEIRIWLKFEEDRTTLPTMRTGSDATPPVSAVPITPPENSKALATPEVPTVIFRLLDQAGHYGPAFKDSIQAAWKPLSDLKDKPNGFTNLQVRFGLDAKPFILFKDLALLLEKGELSLLASSDFRLKTFWTEKDHNDITMTMGFDKRSELAETFGPRPSPVTTADIYPLEFTAVWGDGSPFFDSTTFAKSTRLPADDSKKAGILPFVIYLKPLLPLTPASIANVAPPAMSGTPSPSASAAKAASEMAETKRLEEAKKKADDEAAMAAKHKEAEMAKTAADAAAKKKAADEAAMAADAKIKEEMAKAKAISDAEKKAKAEEAQRKAREPVFHILAEKSNADVMLTYKAQFTDLFPDLKGGDKALLKAEALELLLRSASTHIPKDLKVEDGDPKPLFIKIANNRLTSYIALGTGGQAPYLRISYQLAKSTAEPQAIHYLVTPEWVKAFDARALVASHKALFDGYSLQEWRFSDADDDSKVVRPVPTEVIAANLLALLPFNDTPAKLPKHFRQTAVFKNPGKEDALLSWKITADAFDKVMSSSPICDLNNLIEQAEITLVPAPVTLKVSEFLGAAAVGEVPRITWKLSKDSKALTLQQIADLSQGTLPKGSLSEAAPAPKQLRRVVDPGAKDHGILIVLDNYKPWMRGNTRIPIWDGIEAALKRLPIQIKTNAVLTAGVLSQGYTRFDLKALTDDNERYKVMLKLQSIQFSQYHEQLHGTTPLEFGQILLGENPSDNAAENDSLRTILRSAKAWSVVFICPPLTSHSEVKPGEATGSTANSTSEPAQLNYAMDELVKGRDGRALLAETDIDMRFLILSPDVKAYTTAPPATVRIIEKTDPQPSPPIGDAISDFFK